MNGFETIKDDIGIVEYKNLNMIIQEPVISR